jgi:hypothetical protein
VRTGASRGALPFPSQSASPTSAVPHAQYWKKIAENAIGWFTSASSSPSTANAIPPNSSVSAQPRVDGRVVRTGKPPRVLDADHECEQREVVQEREHRLDARVREDDREPHLAARQHSCAATGGRRTSAKSA